MTSTARKPAKTTRTARATDQPGVYDWLERAGLERKDILTGSKLTLLALTRPQIFDLKVNIIGVLLAQAHGYNSELAVVMRKLRKGESAAISKRVVRLYKPNTPDAPVLCTEVMTTAALALKLKAAALAAYAESGVVPNAEQLDGINYTPSARRQHLRRALETLENDGLIERARLECLPRQLAGLSYDQAVETCLLTPLWRLKPAEKIRLGSAGGGRIGIFLLARPKPAKTFGINVAMHGYINDSKSSEINEAFQQILPFLARADRALAPVVAAHPDTAAALEAFAKARAELQQTVDRLVELQHEAARVGKPALTSAAAPPAAEASPHEAAEQAPALQPAVEDARPVASPVHRPSAAVNPKGSEDQTGRTSAGDTGRTRTSASPTAAEPLITETEVSVVLDAMLPFCPCGCGVKIVRELILRCRELSPGCTAVEIAEAVRAKGPMAKQKGNPPGFLRVAVPELFEGPAASQWRSRVLHRESQDAAEARRADEQQRAMLTAQVDRARMLLRVPEGECPGCGNRPPAPPCVHYPDRAEIANERAWAHEVLREAGLE